MLLFCQILRNERKMAIKLIILDRDGVINKEIKWVAKPEEFEFIDGAVEAIANFKQAGYLTAIATNQSHISRGRMTDKDLTDIHNKMLTELRKHGGDIDRIVYCPTYDDNDPHRKPNPGMLLELMQYFDVSSDETVFIGDYERDMQAGERAGCHLVMIKNKHGEEEYQNMNPELKAKTAYTNNLLGAYQIISEWEKPDKSSSN